MAGDRKANVESVPIRGDVRVVDEKGVESRVRVEVVRD
jgi:hypothetical protein